MLAPAMNLERDGAAMVRGYLDEEPLRRIVDIIEIAFAYLVSGQGDQTVRELWGSVGVVTLPSLNRCGVASELARELSSLLEWEANRLLGPSYLLAVHCSIRRMYLKSIRLEWHTDYDGGGTSGYDPCYIIWLPLTAVGDKSTLSRDRARVASAHARSSVSVAAQRTVSRRVGRQIFCARRPRHARARAR